MSRLVIRARENGPFVVEQPVTVVDHRGHAFDVPAEKPVVALCRCGHSMRKPFCDGTHRSVGFAAAELAPEPSP